MSCIMCWLEGQCSRPSMSPWLQDLVQQRSHFCSSQQADIDQLKTFVDGQRLKRKMVS